MFKTQCILSVLLMACCFSFSSCDDGNDSCKYKIHPTQIAISQVVAGSVQADGSVYYTFDVTTAGNYGISLFGLNHDADLYLYYYEGTCMDNYSYEIDFSENDDTATESIGTYLSADTYLIEVSQFDGYDTSFSLTVTEE